MIALVMMGKINFAPGIGKLKTNETKLEVLSFMISSYFLGLVFITTCMKILSQNLIFSPSSCPKSDRFSQNLPVIVRKG